MKKRLLAALISALMIFPQIIFCVSAESSEPTSFGTVLINETFDKGNPADDTAIDGYNGWTDVEYDTGAHNSSNTIKTEENSTNKVASLLRTATTAAPGNNKYIRKEMSVPEGTTLVSIKFKLRRTDDNARRFVLYLEAPHSGNANGRSFTNYYLDGSDLYDMTNGSGSENVDYGEINDWNDIELALDYSNSKAYYYVNNEKLFSRDLNTSATGIYAFPTAIRLGSWYSAGAWSSGMKNATADAEFQVDDILVTAYTGDLAYSSPENGKTGVDITTSQIDLIFNYEIADSSGAVYTIASDETSTVPEVKTVTYDTLNKRKVTLTLEGSFDYNKKYKVSAQGIKDTYEKDLSAEIEFTTRERRFMINTPVFTIGGVPAAAIANGTVKAKIRIDNEFTSEKPLTVVAASFMANGQLKDIDYTVTAVDGEDYIEPELTVDAVSDGKISLFILDSFSALNPVIGEYVFDSQGLSEPSAINPTSATSLSATVDYDGSGKATISGDAGEGSVAVLVLKPNFAAGDLTETNRESASSMIEYIGLAEGSTFSKTYVPRTPVDNLNNYSAYASGVSTPVSFRVFDAATVTKVLNAVKDGTKETLRDMLKAENPTLLDGSLNINDILALNLTDYYTLTEPQLVTGALAGQTFTKVSDLRTRYNEVLTEKLQYERDGKALVTAVNDALWSDLELLLTNNDSVLTLDWSGDYQNISDKDTFYKRLASDYTFTTDGTTVTKAIENIRGTFSALAKAIVEEEANDTDEEEYYSPGGGGGGGGGKTIKLPAQPVVMPEEESVDNTGIDFRDLDSVPWAQEAIAALAKEGIVNGMSDDNFEPNATVTREQFVKMLVLAFRLPMEFSDAPFIDVTASDWYYYYVHTAYKHGIVMGSSTFGSGKAISRAEMAAMCYRALQANGMELDSSTSSDFADASFIPEYAKEAVAALSGKGIINGMGDNTFAPNDNSSRAQAAKIIYGILQLKGGID